MKIEYEDYLEIIGNEDIKRMIALVCDDFLTELITECNDENISSSLLISMSDMLDYVQESGVKFLDLDEYLLGRLYPEFCEYLVNLIEAVADPLEKQNVYGTFQKILVGAILNLIAVGMRKGTITSE